MSDSVDEYIIVELSKLASCCYTHVHIFHCVSFKRILNSSKNRIYREWSVIKTFPNPENDIQYWRRWMYVSDLFENIKHFFLFHSSLCCCFTCLSSPARPTRGAAGMKMISKSSSDITCMFMYFNEISIRENADNKSLLERFFMWIIFP